MTPAGEPQSSVRADVRTSQTPNESSRTRYDAVVIGAGLNGLTAATALARAGRKIVVLEQRAAPGGLAAGEEFHPGYRSAGLLHDTSGLLSEAVEQLDLARHGLRRADQLPSVYCPARGDGLLLHHDPGRAAASLNGDAAHYAHYRALLSRLRPFARTLFADLPPDWLAEGLTDLRTLLSRGLAFRRLGKVDMMELLRIAPMSLNDWLAEQFDNPQLQAALALPALHGCFAGPWSPGTAGPLLRHETLAGGAVAGGPAAIVDALTAAARSEGVDLRTSKPVAKVVIENGRASGVACEDGVTIHARIVVSSCDPKQTLLRFVDVKEWPPEFAQHIRAYRTRSLTAKVNLALNRPLRFRARPDLDVEFARTAQSLLELERAFDAAKYGHFSDTPVLDIYVPTVSNPALAPPGHAVVSILVFGVPYDLHGGWTDARRKELGDAVVGRLSDCAKDLESSVVAREVLAPPDIESRYGTTGGHIYHGEHGLDQLLVRPAPQCARYATPIAGLYLCGSGTHPGGGLTCAPGLIAARTVLTARR
jgi:phytoene dehydrogenase-like protein